MEIRKLFILGLLYCSVLANLKSSHVSVDAFTMPPVPKILTKNVNGYILASTLSFMIVGASGTCCQVVFEDLRYWSVHVLFLNCTSPATSINLLCSVEIFVSDTVDDKGI